MSKFTQEAEIKAYVESVEKELAKMGIDLKAAFSDDVYVCKNCGHEYVGERLCPECGA